MRNSRKILTLLVLLLVTLTAAAQDVVSPQGCRRGTPRIKCAKLLHRGAAGGQQKRAGGDFYKGERHQLVVLAEFSDKKFSNDETTTIEQWGKILNAEGYNEGDFKGSVHDYFYAQSYKQFDLIFDLIFLSLDNSITKYRSWDTGYDDKTDDDENSQYLVNDIMEALQTRNIDWSLYDWNGDGFINQLLIIYAGKGMNDGGDKNSIWAHQWWLSEHKKDRQEDVYCEPFTITSGDRQYKVDCYCATPELKGKNATFGTLCHEFSHCFGLPDFYYGGSSFVGSWDLMDRGNYNGGGYCPPEYSSHERYLMGWLTPKELTEATTISSMQALSDEPVAYLIRNDGYENEYYFVENRQQGGWDASTAGKGIVVFHIDYDEAVWCGVSENVNVSGGKQRYTIFHANDASSNSGWPYPYYSNTELTNTSTPKAILIHPNTDGKMLMSKPLTNMAVNNGMASFDFMGGATGLNTIERTNHTDDAPFYNLAGQRVTNPQQGIYIVKGRKVVVSKRY